MRLTFENRFNFKCLFLLYGNLEGYYVVKI